MWRERREKQQFWGQGWVAVWACCPVLHLCPMRQLEPGMVEAPGRRHGHRDSGCHCTISRTACGRLKSLSSSLWSWNSVAVSQWHSTPCEGGKLGHRLPCRHLFVWLQGCVESWRHQGSKQPECVSPPPFICVLVSGMGVDWGGDAGRFCWLPCYRY